MFITLEGIEGSGKTSQMESIAGFLEKLDYKVVLTREPGDTSIGKKIRSILLDPGNKEMSSMCELLLYGADRAQHVAQVIRPSLEAGCAVICDRFADATTVYQGVARGLDRKVIQIIHDSVVQDLWPDITVLFDLDPEIGLKRTVCDLQQGNRSENEARFEQEHLSFHHKVRQGYLELARNNPDRFMVVDASQSKDQVTYQIIRGLEKRLKKNT